MPALVWSVLLLGIGVVMPSIFPGGGRLAQLGFVAIFATVAYSMSLTYRYAGILMVAQGSVWGVGAFLGTYLVTARDWNTWAAMPVTIVAGGLVAGLVGAVALRSRGHYFLIVGLAANELIVFAGTQVDALGRSDGLLLVTPPDPLGPFTFTEPMHRYYLNIVALAIVVAIFVGIGGMKFGRKLIAIRENEDLARSLGIPVARTQIQVLVLGGFIAGGSGFLYAYQQLAITPNLFSALIFLQVLSMVIIGGTRSTYGTVLGAAVLIVLPDELGFEPLTSQLLYGVLIVLVILLLPDGVGGLLSSAASGLRRYVFKWRGDAQAAPASTRATTETRVNEETADAVEETTRGAGS